ncbi:MAG TPA: hypothetical protein ACFYEK_10915 [Candidatus Wunengus sp. YC60]|uniref:hypothetical protein n=1 Tax=Candidatus Wunengus sp. YC60 TaxID=3367697 RepID=UPI004025B136
MDAIKKITKSKDYDYLGHFKKEKYLKNGHNFSPIGFMVGFGRGLEKMSSNIIKAKAKAKEKEPGQLFTLFKE